jgi:hypothetical protein
LFHRKICGNGNTNTFYSKATIAGFLTLKELFKMDKPIVEVDEIIELEEGGATVMLYLNEPARSMLLEDKILDILRERINEMETE